MKRAWFLQWEMVMCLNHVKKVSLENYLLLLGFLVVVVCYRFDDRLYYLSIK